MSFRGTAKQAPDGGRFPLQKEGLYQYRVNRALNSGHILGPLTILVKNAPPPFCWQIDCQRFTKLLNDLFKEASRERILDLKDNLASFHQRQHLVKMPSSCKEIRAALAQCLQESDCVMVYRNKASDCLRPPLVDTLPTKCQQLKKGFGECKRGMVDMRKRFRGNQPMAVSKEIEGGAENPSHQLYAGKPAFGTGVKATSGNEPEEPDWREVENEKYRKSGN